MKVQVKGVDGKVSLGFVSLLFAAELLLCTLFRNQFGCFISPIIIFTSGLALGLILMMDSFNPSSMKYQTIDTLKSKQTTKPISLIDSIWFFGFVFVSWLSYKIFQKWSVDFNDASLSDIIPQIGWLVQRFIKGEYPYQIIDVWGYQLFPTYQTFQWFPYTISEIFNFDYRWIAFAILSISFYLFQREINKSSIPISMKIIFALLPWGLLMAYINSDKLHYAHTVESLIAAYYLIFLVALFSKSVLFKSLSTILCLLSRYSLILWLGFYAVHLFSERKKTFIRYSLFVVIGITLFYVIPFMSKDPSIFLKGFDYHTKAANSIWKLNDGVPSKLLFNGMGFTSFVYSYVVGDFQDKLKFAQSLHLGISSFSVLLIAGLYFRLKNRIKNQKLYLLGSFKVYLCFFYGFIQLPFSYLYLVSLVVSMYCLWKHTELVFVKKKHRLRGI